MDADSLWRLPAMRRLWVTSLLGFVSFTLTLAALPAYAVSVGIGAGTAGLVTTVMLGSTVAIQAVVPALTERFGIWPVFAVGLVALGAPAPLYLISPQLWWLLVIGVVRGGGFAVLTVLGATVAAALVGPARRGEAVGIYGLSSALPGLLAVPAGVALTLDGRFGWVAVLAAAPVLVAPLAWAQRRSPVQALPEETGVGGTNRAAALACLAPAVVLVFTTLAGGGVITFLPIERPDGVIASVALLAFGVTSAVARWQAGRLADRIGTGLLLPSGLLLTIGGLVLLAVGLWRGSDGTIVGGGAVVGAGYGTVQNLTLVLSFARAGPRRATTASAVWNASFDLGTAIGAVAVGALALSGLGLAGSFVVCAGAVLLTVPVALASAPERRGGRSA